jgi:hypothetical protein
MSGCKVCGTDKGLILALWHSGCPTLCDEHYKELFDKTPVASLLGHIRYEDSTSEDIGRRYQSVLMTIIFELMDAIAKGNQHHELDHLIKWAKTQGIDINSKKSIEHESAKHSP